VAANTFQIQGRSVELPCVVRDASSANATYLVSAGAARRLLPGDAIDVVELLPGRALMSLAVIEYRDNDLGDYNEISMAFFVRERAERAGYLRTLRDLMTSNLRTYIHRLPVTQAFTCEAGCRIWGFPKTLGEIEIQRDSKGFHCSFDADGQHVLDFSMARTEGSRELPEMTTKTYTYIEGAAHRTPFVMAGSEVALQLGGAKLELGDHPIADELRSLGLPKRPLMSTFMGKMTGRFEAPEKL